MANKAVTREEFAPFNMAMLFYISLRKLIDAKNQKKMAGDLLGWYHGLEAIYDEIIFKLNADEERELDKLFDDARNLVYADRSDNRAIAFQVENTVRTIAPKKLRNIDKKIMRALDRYKMIFPEINTVGGLANLTQSYGL